MDEIKQIIVRALEDQWRSEATRVPIYADEYNELADAVIKRLGQNGYVIFQP